MRGAPTEAARTQLEEAGTLNPLIGKAIALGEEHPHGVPRGFFQQ
ncbi:MAG: hypothetical protein ACLRRT_14130 [Ruthenibacterium lactatiformans]